MAEYLGHSAIVALLESRAVGGASATVTPDGTPEKNASPAPAPAANSREKEEAAERAAAALLREEEEEAAARAKKQARRRKKKKKRRGAAVADEEKNDLPDIAPLAFEESKSPEVAAPPPPPGKVLVDEILDDAAAAAARAAALETSLTAHQEELRRLKGLLTERGIPDGLVCPLSLEIYEDPVMAADGFSYERREIATWFARGKRTSPKTNEELPHTFLTPNHDLKAMCQDFLAEVRKFEL
ncbi:unnamed protein product [Pelagomonas calceolata]|uniref:U-box domain-containing protein n=1 Tax=Pelagomonas calceolata TaxID=35677 RepID=A0A8J2STU4_9STRA|nr:unnamed protein product [Pelagomonas calceolata]